MARPIRLSPSGIFIPVAMRFMVGRALPQGPPIILPGGVTPLAAFPGLVLLASERLYFDASLNATNVGGAPFACGIFVTLTPTSPPGPPVSSITVASSAVPVGESATPTNRGVIVPPADGTYTLSWSADVALGGGFDAGSVPNGGALFAWVIDAASSSV